jgi:hypothetical protein
LVYRGNNQEKKPKATSSKFLTYQLSTVLVYSGNDQEKAKSHQNTGGRKTLSAHFLFWSTADLGGSYTQLGARNGSQSE